MNATAITEDAALTPKRRHVGKLLPAIAIVVLAALAGALCFAGVLPLPAGLLHHSPGAKSAQEPTGEAAAAAAPVFLDIPELVTNLNAGPRRAAYLKLHAKLELGDARDLAIATAALPRLLDLFQTYLREMRPEDLRGSEGTYRLREELVARANIAAAPAQILNVLFTEMLVQ
ncbi:MAG TPA: flagellar basal body-associated FliL family protein [Acetobacteraceae bacterium]|jgi:flagellar FliL protein|nr:flagellar basal body-associated FliL family protein [Acetobacteraceae bacterium]